jgi:CBS domain-containing protein
MKGLTPDNFHLLQSPTIAYLSFVQKAIKVPVGIDEKTTFPMILKTMSQHHIHRLFIVDNEFKPKGLISVTDIINALYSHSESSH